MEMSGNFWQASLFAKDSGITKKCVILLLKNAVFRPAEIITLESSFGFAGPEPKGMISV